LQTGSSAIVLHPLVIKSLIKGTIAIAIFSVFLNVNSGNFASFLFFLFISYLFVGVYMYWKRGSRYTLDASQIEVKSFLRAPRIIKYADIDHVSISQGMLAKRFNCGTLYLNLRHSGGHVKIFGGGSAEALRDVRDPDILLASVNRKLLPRNEEDLE
jgi:membrane protein YdbS with pleckstrin-like domain